jgi:adenosine deaminase
MNTEVDQEYAVATSLGCSDDQLAALSRSGIAAAFTSQTRRALLEELG